ncbi:MAG: PAS domain S-box protein [Nannocystaceae bacterium]
MSGDDDEARRVRETLHRALFEEASVGLAIADDDGRVLVVNDALLAILGLPRAAVTGLESALPGGVGARLVARARVGETVDGVVIPLLRGDGELLEARVSLRALAHEGRLATLARIEDITEESRRQAGLLALAGELAQVRGDAFFRGACERLAGLLGVEVVYVAERTPGAAPLRTLGLALGGLPLGSPAPIRHLSALGLPDAGGSRIIEDGAAEHLPECALVRAHGIRGAAALTLHDPAGDVIGVIGAMSRKALRRPAWVLSMLRLFAARVGAEIERERERHRLQELFQLAPDAELLVRGDGRIVLVNRKAVELFGYSEAELLGLTVEALVPDEHRRRHVGLRGSFLEGQKPLGMAGNYRPLSALAKGGGRIPVDISLATLRADEGSEVIVTIRDLRDRFAFEAQRRALELQLRQSQKLETLGTLASGIAHDFNNLLAVIVANVEWMQRDPGVTEGLSASLGAVSVAASRATELVQRILGFTRRQPAQRTVTSVAAVVREVAGLLRPVLPAWIRIDVELDGDVPPVLADPTHLHQVVTNLVTNAAHAIGRAPGVITIRVEGGGASPSVGAPGTRCTRLLVGDTGGGVPPEILPRIFEPFFTTKAAGEGSGLGLSVVQSLIHEHGGVIWVASEPGHGAKFCVELPAVDAERAHEPPRSEPIHGRGHVLFIDDEELLVSVGEALLGRLGYTVTAHARARDALELIREDPGRFDVVITDYEMPELSGVEVAREIARVAPNVPVILASGRRSREEDDLGAEGVRLQISKPYGVRELSDVLARARAAVGAASERS